MAPTQIDGAKQIKSASISTTQLSATAGITDGQLATAYIKADGTRAFGAALNLGGFKSTNQADGTADTDGATWGQVKSMVNGLDVKASVRLASTGAETYTIAGGAVTQITGTTLDGVALVIGNRVLFKNAPTTTGAGVPDTNATGSNNPANGLYDVTGTTTNATFTRSSDADVNAEVTAGLTVTTAEGTNHADSTWTLISNDPITVNTTALQFTQTDRSALTFSGGLTKTGNSVKRDDLTGGDVTTTGNGVIATIGAGAVTLAKMANLAANSVIANNTGSAAVPTALGLTAAATAATAMVRDANANVRLNNVIENFQTIVSAAGTTTLVVGSPKTTQITGATTQTVVLPDATTLVLGQSFIVINRSSGAVTVNANGGGLVQTMVGGSFVEARVTNIGSAAGTWDAAYTAAGGSGSVTTVSVVTANGFQGSVANASTTPAITLQTSLGAGIIRSNGSNALALASNTAGADYVNASNFVTRETPGGTINGSNTAFTLAFTPIAGTEQIFLNGLLQEPGAGNDYTISGLNITFLTAPVGGGTPDKIRASYMK
jgi:hypothetical protein